MKDKPLSQQRPLDESGLCQAGGCQGDNLGRWAQQVEAGGAGADDHQVPPAAAVQVGGQPGMGSGSRHPRVLQCEARSI